MTDECELVDLSEDDVLEAMRMLHGYVDITPGTFREIYALAFDAALRRIRSQKKAGDIMTAPVHVMRMDLEATEAVHFLARCGISGAPVVDAAGRVVGMISEKDFLRKLGLQQDASLMAVIAAELDSAGLQVAALHGVQVQELMTVPAIVAEPNASVSDISELFSRHAIKRIPICDDAGQVVGIITRSDIVCSLCSGGMA